MKDKANNKAIITDGMSAWFDAYSRGINCYASGEYCSSYEDSASKVEIPDLTEEFDNIEKEKKALLEQSLSDTAEAESLNLTKIRFAS